ncbi:hypothetical protein [Paenibacillus tuaregi]|uniref:hypothetical protein n=1 Tax=Paenibacillus tuaregi TaxID=1816681 RepID=UPI000838C0A5|nr:hypothetical protein [Paenibacillus tuaregi]
MTTGKVIDLIDAAIEEAEHNPDIEGEDVLVHAVNAVRERFGITCNYAYCGGFDSAGYDIDCYAIAFVTSNGELGIYDYQIESY